MKVQVLDIKGNKVKEMTLSDSVFKIVPNKEVLAQYLRVYKMNQRQGTSNTKTRAEVRGGGKKPHKQKHTGRARAGSSRSPIWVGGGITHGPRSKSWNLSLPKKIRQLAMKSALSKMFLENGAIIVDKIDAKEPKTKEIMKSLEKILSDRDTLIVWKERNENLLRGSTNLPDVYLSSVENVNPYELLSVDKVVFLEDAAKFLEEKYKK